MSAASALEPVDVAIVGGGAAGLTLAVQLRLAVPDLRIVIVERAQHPVPETIHKVGESTVEIAGHYLRDILGLGEHLSREQLNKYGLRIFFTHKDNSDIARRVELGHATYPPAAVGTYQVDRGRLENALAERVVREGADLVDGSQVRRVKLGDGQTPHEVHFSDADGNARTVAARWVVDATGRAAFLKRDLNLAKKGGHHANAVWFRIASPINLEDWSTDPEWHARIIEGRRELSTNHLMGKGYWVWMIRLSSGGISIGIVTDPTLHPFEQMKKFDLALQWLGQHEPQLAAVVDSERAELLDFRVMTDFSYGVDQVFSDGRWCLTGESGLFLDPLYSPGLDLIAISNGLVSDLIVRDHAGEDVSERASIHNQVYLLITSGWLNVYENQYATMGSPRAMLAKVIWDTAVYWAVVGLLYFQDALRELIDQPEIVLDLARFSTLSRDVQQFFGDWAALDDTTPCDEFVRFYDFDFMRELHSGMTALPNDTTLSGKFTENVRLIEQLSGQLVATVMDELADDPREQVQLQLQRWKTNTALMSAVAVHQADSPINPISDRWINAMAPQPVQQGEGGSR